MLGPWGGFYLYSLPLSWCKSTYHTSFWNYFFSGFPSTMMVSLLNCRSNITLCLKKMWYLAYDWCPGFFCCCSHSPSNLWFFWNNQQKFSKYGLWAPGCPKTFSGILWKRIIFMMMILSLSISLFHCGDSCTDYRK